MRNHILKSSFLTVSLIFFTLIGLSISVNAAPQDYESIGITEGEKYVWTMTKVDQKILIENLTGNYGYFFIREGKQFIYNIERVIANKKDLDFDNWTIEYEEWDLSNEINDDGADSKTYIYKDPNVFAVNPLDTYLTSSCNPTQISIRLVFIPKKTEDFLTEAVSLYGGPGSLSVDGKKLNWESASGLIVAKLTYDTSGVLIKANVEYKDKTCYILELTESGPIGAISMGLFFIPIGAITIISMIIIFKKTGKIKHKKV